MAFTTADDIVERVLDIIEALTPDTIPGSRFRRYRGEGDGDFVTWCEASPESAFRRVQARHNGSVRVPDVSNGDFEERETTITVLIAYPNDGRAGKNQTRSRDQLIGLDLDQLERAIGLYSRANFTPPNPDAFFRDWSSARIAQDACTFLSVEVTYAFYRALTNLTTLTAALTDSTDPLTANGGAFSYTLDINNTGIIPAENVVATVTLPTGVGYTSASGTGWTCTNSGQFVTCRRESGDTGALPTITISCTAPNDAGAGSMTASVTVSAANVESIAADSEDTTLIFPPRLVIIAGQSNAVGIGATSDLSDASYADAYPAVRYKWQISTAADNPPTYNTRANFGDLEPIQSNLFGIEASLGRALDTDGSATWYIAKFAVSETSFVANWSPDNAYPTADPDGINLYTRFKNYVQAAMAEANTEDVTLCWVHGETDTRTTGGSQNYADNFEDFVTQLRADLGIDLPVVYGRLNANYSWTVPERNATRAMQESMRALLPGMSMVDQDGAELGVDNVHYTADGYVTLGERYAAKVLTPDSQLTTVTTDGTSSWKFPANATEEAAFRVANGLTGMCAPTSIFTMQDASGGAIDANGVRNLSAVGSLSYLQVVAGQSRKGIAIPGATNSYLQNAAVPNNSTNSGLLILVAVVTNAAALRSIMAQSVSVVDTGMLQTATGKLRIDGSAGLADGTVTLGFSAVHAYGIHVDYSAPKLYGFHDGEKVAPTYGAIQSGQRIWFGSCGGTSSPIIATYGLWWEGSRAEAAKGVTEANIKAYLAGMGIPQAW